MDRDWISKMTADSKPASKMSKNVQSTLPDTLDTNSWITRVFPVPHAISRTRAPLAHASRQSRWHCLKGGMPPVPSAGEGSPAFSLTRSLGTKGIEGKKGAVESPFASVLKVAKLILYIHHTLHAPSGGHNVFSGQSSSEIQFLAISQNVLPTPSLFIVRFVMRQCSALEFRSHALTFSGNRRLLVTTVHFGACTGWKDTSPRLD